MRVFKTIAGLAATALLLAAAGCDDGASTARTSPTPAPAPSPPAAVAGGKGPLVVFFGDSLTAGYGLAEDQAYPALVAARIEADGLPIRVVNAGVSGDTSAGGLRRIDWVLRQSPDVVVVGLGGNDALRGQPLEEIESNLDRIVSRIQDAGAAVLLLGMRIPTNYGPEYTEGFHAVYRRVAEARGVPLVPFLLEGVGGHPELNLPDGLHPNARGHEIVAGNVLPALEPIVRARAARR